jgi:hypothetical protein
MLPALDGPLLEERRRAGLRLAGAIELPARSRALSASYARRAASRSNRSLPFAPPPSRTCLSSSRCATPRSDQRRAQPRGYAHQPAAAQRHAEGALASAQRHAERSRRSMLRRAPRAPRRTAGHQAKASLLRDGSQRLMSASRRDPPTSWPRATPPGSSRPGAMQPQADRRHRATGRGRNDLRTGLRRAAASRLRQADQTSSRTTIGDHSPAGFRRAAFQPPGVRLSQTIKPPNPALQSQI